MNEELVTLAEQLGAKVFGKSGAVATHARTLVANLVVLARRPDDRPMRRLANQNLDSVEASLASSPQRTQGGDGRRIGEAG